MLGGNYDKVSVRTLAVDLKEAMEELFELFESEAVKVILYYANRPKSEDVIQRALKRYALILQQRMNNYKAKGFVTYHWEVPADRLYKEDTNHVVDEVRNHALMPFVQLNTASNPEREFTTFLEANTEYIDWWYKNGDAGKQHYAVGYTNTKGKKALFYVDFVVRMKNGQLFLFDTKSMDSDPEAVNKHNALIEYMNDEKNKKLNLKGGVIIHWRENWKYSPLKIENTTDIVNWDSFYPDEY